MIKRLSLLASGFLFSLLLIACGGQAQSAVPGADSVRTFKAGQCILIWTSDHPAYTEPGPGSVPVGQSLPGEQAALQAVTFADGSLWYLKDDGVWFRADGADYETRGECGP